MQPKKSDNGDSVLGYRIVEVPYRLVLNGEYKSAIIDHHDRTIRISSLVPSSDRILAGCYASLLLARRIRQSHGDHEDGCDTGRIAF